MAEKMLTYKGLVYPWHCDHMGHMNVMWYVGKFDEATWAFFGHLGLTAKMLRSSDRGMAAVEQQISYQREAFPGDMLEVYTRPIKVTTKSIRFVSEMIDAETKEVLAICELVGVHLDTSTRKSTALPESIREKAMAMIEG